MQAIGEFIVVKNPKSDDVTYLESGLVLVGDDRPPVLKLEVASVGNDVPYAIFPKDIITVNVYGLTDLGDELAAVHYAQVYAKG